MTATTGLFKIRVKIGHKGSLKGSGRGLGLSLANQEGKSPVDYSVRPDVRKRYDPYRDDGVQKRGHRVWGKKGLIFQCGSHADPVSIKVNIIGQGGA